MPRSQKATETFAPHYVKQASGQNKATYKPLGVLEVNRSYTSGEDSQHGNWLQLVPGADFSRTRAQKTAAQALQGKAMRVQFDDIIIHSQHPAFSRIDFKG
jgi:hypothetical protein